jgi:hypothetical protein
MNKTLKDIQFVHDFNGEGDGFSANMINPNDLKKCAIEAIKELNENYHKDHVYNTIYQRGLIAAGKVEFIKEFFGLTEEDLNG